MKIPFDSSCAPGDCWTLFFDCDGVSGFGVSVVAGAVPFVCGRVAVGAVVPFEVSA